jgi:dipeptidyl-peptidase 4
MPGGVYLSACICICRMKKILLFLALCGPFFLFAQKSITLDDCFTAFRFYPKGSGDYAFTPDGQHYYGRNKTGIGAFLLRNDSLDRLIIPDADLKGIPDIDAYVFNEEESLALISSNTEPVYRHSVLAQYWVYQLRKKTLLQLARGEKLQYVALSPTGDGVAYVQNNNIFYLNLNTGNTEQVTSDGLANQVINGLPDWVYEEEFSPVSGEGMSALRWSPDGSRLAFIRFDESKVKEYKMNWYNGDMYPGKTSFKYPKVGEDNSTVSVHVYNIEDRSRRKVMGLETDDYATRLHWTTDSRLVLTRLNRRQDTLELLLALDRPMYDAEENVTYVPVRPLLQETSAAYVEMHDNLRFLIKSPHFIWTSEKDGFNHVYLYPMEAGSTEKPRDLTPIDADVTAFYGVDEKNGVFYYQTATPTPMDRQVWEGSLNGGKPRLMHPDKAGTWEANFSAGFDRYILSWSDANTPAVITLNERSGSQVREFTNNNKARQARQEYGFADKEFWSFALPDGTPLHGWMIKPRTLEPGKKYPVLFDVYGGPGSQTVSNQYDGYMDPWRQMLVQKGVIVVSVDNRGTGARGAAFKKCTQLQLGKLETEDQIAAARYLGTLPYVDPGRIGIWGWSFGGYLSTSCILKGNDVFKMAMAVAPVTNWKWYDSAYTERYMHTTRDNKQGYENNSPVNFAELLRGKYLICHGIADDNVHWQQTTEMIEALIKANRQFETMYYPNRNHGIYGDNATMHLFTKLTNFVLNQL